MGPKQNEEFVYRAVLDGDLEIRTYECLDCHQFFWTVAEFEEHECGYESEDE
jgi:hypothetical protein